MRITKSSENASGNLTEAQVKFMNNLNNNPTFSKSEKEWVLVKIPKSTTRNVAWHIRINGENFLAIQLYSKGESVKVYHANEKGKSLGMQALAKEYIGYVDLEAAVDRFYQEYANANANA